MSFAPSLRFTLGWEGGKADHPRDRGKRTNYGITQATYTTWLTMQGKPSQDVWTITPVEVSGIYRDWYWRKVWGDEFDALDPRLALVLFDAGVHHGCGQSVKFFQRALHQGLAADGIPGAQTLAAAHRVWGADGARDALRETLQGRRELMKNLASRDATQQDFLRGWLSRVSDIEEVVAMPATDFTVAVALHQRMLPKGYV